MIGRVSKQLRGGGVKRCDQVNIGLRSIRTLRRSVSGSSNIGKNLVMVLSPLVVCILVVIVLVAGMKFLAPAVIAATVALT